jgi:pilus assembly protein CpaB
VSAPQPDTGDTEPVVVVTHQVAEGSVLQSGDLSIIEVPAGLVPAGALSEVAGAVGRFVKSEMVAGEMVLGHNLVDPTNVSQDMGYVLEPDQVLLAFPASDLMSTLNIIHRGDLIDIFATIEEQIPVEPEQLGAVEEQAPEANKKLAYTFDALERVQITAMVVEIVESRGAQPALNPTEIQDELQNTDTKTTAFLLALSPQDALVLKHLKDTGAIFDLVLRAPTSSQLFETNPVTTNYLFDRYQLQLPK